jgi:hypothetical protein
MGQIKQSLRIPASYNSYHQSTSFALGVYYGANHTISYNHTRIPSASGTSSALSAQLPPTSIASMTSNHSDRPILRRFFTTTRQRDSAGSTLNTTASFSSITTHFQSQWILVDASESPPGGASDGPEIKQNSQIEQIEGLPEDLLLAIDDDTSPIPRTYQFENCHVYINSFNAHGVQVENSGNYAPRTIRMSFSLLQFSCSYR